MTGPVERVPLTDEQLDEYERIVKRDGFYGDEALGWLGNYCDALVADLRAARVELSVLRPALRAAKRRLAAALENAAECNGLCLTASDVGVSVAGDPVARAHLSCPLHGDPAELGRRADRLLDEERARTAEVKGRIDKALALCDQMDARPEMSGFVLTCRVRAALTGTENTDGRDSS